MRDKCMNKIWENTVFDARQTHETKATEHDEFIKVTITKLDKL